MTTQRLMKDGLDLRALSRIAQGFSTVYAPFPRDQFMSLAKEGLSQLELKERVYHVIAALQRCLPSEFPEQAAILRRIPDHWDRGDPEDPLRGFAAWPVIDLVAVSGLEHRDLALLTLRDLTHLFTAEFAIRPFLLQDLAGCLPHLQRFSEDPSEAVRRLASEGTRPRLPWGVRLPMLIVDPSPTLPILERLRDDPSDTVRRSVANHLNDISKDHPELVVSLCQRWAQGAPSTRHALLRHALRTLVKAGHPSALALKGADGPPKQLTGEFFLGQKQLTLGESQSLHLRISTTSPEAQRLEIDFAVHLQGGNGNTRRKVFKWMTLDLLPGRTVQKEKRVPFRPITTRRYYDGPHRIDLLLNGHIAASASFELVGATRSE